jgi:hypothetical protein
MLSLWIAVEHDRLHLVERWPDSPRKEATLAAIYSTLASLGQDSQSPTVSPECVVCYARRAAVLDFPNALRIAPAKADSARSRPNGIVIASSGAVSGTGISANEEFPVEAPGVETRVGTGAF